MAPQPKLGRISFVFLVLFFIGGFMLFNLFEKQVVEHKDFAKAAEDQSVGESTIPAARGKIFAKDKNKSLTHLAVSEWRYNLLISPRQVKNKKNLADALAADYSGVTAAAILEEIDNDKVYVPPVAKGLSSDDAQKIRDKGYAGVFLIPQLIRSYPEGESIAAQIIGFVGGDGEGKYGVEAYYDDVLRGNSGVERRKQDSLGRLIDVLGTEDSEPGADLVLTIDYNLQFIVETKLKEALEKYQAESGSIIVMDPKTGAILALSGQPTFDPNSYSKLRGDEQQRFLSPAASDAYEPGSVIKPITMSMALDLGVITPETTEVFGKSVTVLDKTIMNADEKVFGRENMSQVLENSDNVAMVWIGDKIGTEKQREYFTKYGFGAKSGVDLIGERAGYIPQLKDWNDLLRATSAFGQGISANLIQIAAAYSVIGNDGQLVTPHVAEKTVRGEKAENLEFKTRGQVIKPEVAKQVREMLANVVVNGHGKRAKVDGIRVGGKTGTAQVANPEGGYHEDKFIGTFAGLFPVEDPKFVMVVRLNNPRTVRFAESSAAPTFGEIAEWITNYYQLR